MHDKITSNMDLICPFCHHITNIYEHQNSYFKQVVEFDHNKIWQPHCARYSTIWSVYRQKHTTMWSRVCHNETTPFVHSVSTSQNIPMIMLIMKNKFKKKEKKK